MQPLELLTIKIINIILIVIIIADMTINHIFVKLMLSKVHLIPLSMFIGCEQAKAIIMDGEMK